jgi:dihydropteroate synthase
VDDALRMAERYRSWGASLIDLGGQSSHLDNPTIEEGEEISRVVPVIEALAAEGHQVAIDTWKPGVALAAAAAGVVLINDTGGLGDPGMREVVRQTGLPTVAVYVEGANPHDVDAIGISATKASDTAEGFRALLAELAEEGIEDVILDPGIALSYRGDYAAYTRQQLEVIAASTVLHELGKPLLIPIPRKRDFHRVVAYLALACEHKADLIRVHDVAVAVDIARLFGRLP